MKKTTIISLIAFGAFFAAVGQTKDDSSYKPFSKKILPEEFTLSRLKIVRRRTMPSGFLQRLSPQTSLQILTLSSMRTTAISLVTQKPMG